MLGLTVVHSSTHDGTLTRAAASAVTLDITTTGRRAPAPTSRLHSHTAGYRLTGAEAEFATLAALVRHYATHPYRLDHTGRPRLLRATDQARRTHAPLNP